MSDIYIAVVASRQLASSVPATLYVVVALYLKGLLPMHPIDNLTRALLASVDFLRPSGATIEIISKD